MSDQHPAFITPVAVLDHWQGHRRLTRRVIAAFPDDQLFTFSVGGMRPFGALASEMLGMTLPMVNGALSGEWAMSGAPAPATKDDLLAQWDETTSRLDALFPQLPSERFLETMTAFGQYTGPLHQLLLYVIDNEIHHRGQGYAYLRALEIEPPAFFDRN